MMGQEKYEVEPEQLRIQSTPNPLSEMVGQRKLDISMSDDVWDSVLKLHVALCYSLLQFKVPQGPLI